MPIDFDKLPPVLQLFAIIGVVIGGALMYLRGARSKPAADPYADAERERLAAERERLLREDLNAARLREDLGKVVQALREVFFSRLNEQKKDFEHENAGLENRVRKLEQEIAVLSGTVARLEGRPRPRRPGG